jgi:hypothetical protein
VKGSVGWPNAATRLLDLVQLASRGQSGAFALAHDQPKCSRTHADPSHGACERTWVWITFLAVA